MTEYDLRVGYHILTFNREYPSSKPLTSTEKPFVSAQWVAQFENGYGASVITNQFAFCTHKEPYELAVIHNNELCYATLITDDVIGYLTLEALEPILDAIAQLPRSDNCDHTCND